MHSGYRIDTSVPYTFFESDRIYNILGREVVRLVDGEKRARYQQVVWDGRNRYGNVAASGVYIYRMIAEGVEEKQRYLMTRKVLLLK